MSATRVALASEERCCMGNGPPPLSNHGNGKGVHFPRGPFPIYTFIYIYIYIVVACANIVPIVQISSAFFVHGYFCRFGCANNWTNKRSKTENDLKHSTSNVLDHSRFWKCCSQSYSKIVYQILQKLHLILGSLKN